MACPGSYCGMTLTSGNLSSDYSNLKCEACDWGYRPAVGTSICTKCETLMPLNDWMYLGFMAILPFLLHCISIDSNLYKKSRRFLLTQLSSLLECTTAAIVSLLLLPPRGTLQLYSCGVKSIKDWYPLFFNPLSNEEPATRLQCAHEVVYPLYTLVMIHYSLLIPAMLLYRPFLIIKLVPKAGLDLSRPVYYTLLYYIPGLIVTQAVFGGLLHLCYPYICLGGSVISLVYNLTADLDDDQTGWSLLKEKLSSYSNILMLALHWLMHSYGILSLAGFDDLRLSLPLLMLIPLPFLLFVGTVKYTNPSVVDRYHDD